MEKWWSSWILVSLQSCIHNKDFESAKFKTESPILKPLDSRKFVHAKNLNSQFAKINPLKVFSFFSWKIGNLTLKISANYCSIKIRSRRINKYYFLLYCTVRFWKIRCYIKYYYLWKKTIVFGWMLKAFWKVRQIEWFLQNSFYGSSLLPYPATISLLRNAVVVILSISVRKAFSNSVYVLLIFSKSLE